MALRLSVVILAMGWLAQGQQPEPAESRAVAYLAQEVARWRPENGCFSCHNNGDAARALYRARRLGLPVHAEALSETEAWLSAPERWEESHGDPRFSDKKLARLQFSVAIEEAARDGSAGGRATLEDAAARLAGLQQADGSWPVEDEVRVGSPVTWGVPLATALARGVLLEADRERYREAAAKAEQYLGSLEARTVPDLAAVVLGRPPGHAKAGAAIGRILEAQGSEGGWGPYAKTPAEAFDTALALLALARTREREAEGRRERLEQAIARGRDYLVRTQLAEGGWPETTRPSGATSYAQHMSTTGWATLALLVTREGRP